MSTKNIDIYFYIYINIFIYITFAVPGTCRAGKSIYVVGQNRRSKS